MLLCYGIGRVLRPGGTLWIAEVRSRFAGNDGTENPGPFLAALRSLGFVPLQQDMSNTMFVTFVLEKKGKTGHKSDSAAWPTLKPCIYKRR
jgi:ribosomal RNA-processing protein 8